MPLNLQNVALPLPDGTEFPGKMQELLDLIAAYLLISGQSDFNGINYGATEPDADNRDKPWFRLNDEGLPLGWYSWDGSMWTAIPIILPSGPTASRPLSATAQQIFFDTDIGTAIRYTGSIWTTLAGTPGDTKEVKAATLAEALTKNPGWSWDSESSGMVIGGASSGSSSGDHTYGSTAGSEEVTLAVANLPDAPIDLLSGWGLFPGTFQNGPNSTTPVTNGVSTLTTASMNGGVTQEPISVLQPTIFRWRLVKD